MDNGCRRCVVALVAALVILHACSARAQESAAHRQNDLDASILYLTSSSPAGWAGRNSLLTREMVRQAVLLAAREEVGANTRDVTLGEIFDGAVRSDDARIVLDVETATSNDRRFEGRLTRRDAAGAATPLWDLAVEFSPGDYPVVHAPLLESLELASRTALPQALRQVGLVAGHAPVPDGSQAGQVAATDQVQTQLMELNYYAQFAALRTLHREMRLHGQTPPRLGGLVRAYANLSQLTQLQWCAMRQAFAARALLYAQRMVASNPTSPEALWHRAYAWTMAGRHAEALADLERAQALAHQQQVDRPAWLPLLEASCRYDTASLLEALSADPQAPEAQLAAYLLFLSVEHIDSTSIRLRFISAAMQVLPDCPRLLEALTAGGVIAIQHKTTVQAPGALMSSMVEKMPAALPDLPAAVVSAVQRAQQDPLDLRRFAAITAALDKAADDGAEPSWRILASLLRETMFTHVHRRAWFLRIKLNAGDTITGAYVSEVAPLVSTHPCYPVLRAYSMWSNRAAAIAGLEKMQWVDPNWPMFLLLRNVDEQINSATAGTLARGRVPHSSSESIAPEHRSLWHAVHGNCDDTVADLNWLLDYYAGSRGKVS
jgi:hypothetical protein